MQSRMEWNHVMENDLRDSEVLDLHIFTCAMVKSRVLLGMVIPPLIGILIMGIFSPLLLG